MTKEELIKKLEELGVADHYSLNGYIAPNKTVLYSKDNSWDLFFVDERGEQGRSISFFTPEDAYEYILHLETQIDERHNFFRDNISSQTITTQIAGDGFIMTKTENVDILPQK